MTSLSDDWGPDIDELSSHIDRLAEAVYETAALVREQLDGSDCIPPPEHPCLDRSIEELNRIRPLMEELRDRLNLRPLHLYLSGYLLSREQYYLLLARNVLTFSVEGLEPYEHFRMLHYEDDERRCYINPEEEPRTPGGKLKMRLGVPPEEISWEHLRPEQREYFNRHAADVAARFKREA